MKNKISLESLFIQYLIGLAVNIIFVIILLSTQTSYKNIQLPEGEFSDNLWRGSDVVSYVSLARNFVEYGVFGHELNPSHYRTIGYPFFLSVLMKLFGNKWLIWTFFIHSIIFAFIYPAVSKIITLIFPRRRSIIVTSFLFFIISGVYFSRVTVLYTDLFFTAFFTIGLCFGLLGIVEQKWKYLILQLLFIGYAAQVRPVLILYPIINVFVLISIAKRHNISNLPKVKTLIAVSSIILLILCNAPSIRNYLNYKVFRPTTIFENNLFGFLGHQVLTDNNDIQLFESMDKKIEKSKDFMKQAELAKKYSLEIYKKYPLSTIKNIIYPNIASTLINSHITKVTIFWGYYWREIYKLNKLLLKKSNFVYLVHFIFAFIYLILYIAFLLFLIRLYKSKNYLYFFTILFFILYFLLPTFPAGVGRLRLPFESVIVVFAIYEINSRLKLFKSNKQKFT